jgi:adenine/guanine phosphoribosyltransferase-like PRPP-binding protein
MDGWACRLLACVAVKRTHVVVGSSNGLVTTSDPDWRGRRVTFEISLILEPSDRVLLVDDWIETGSQADAVRRAIEICGAEFVGTSVIVDQTTPSRRSALRVSSLVKATELPPDTAGRN